MSKGFITLETNLDTVKDFISLKSDINTKVIKKGVDEALFKSLGKLKSQLMDQVNDIKDDQTEAATTSTNNIDPKDRANKNMIGNSNTTKELNNLSKAKKELIQYLFDKDLSKAPLNKNYTDDKNANIFRVKNRLIKYRSKIDPYSDYLSERIKAKQAMEDGLFIDEDGNMMSPTGDAEAKPECSNKPGDSDRSEEVFESRKDSLRENRKKAIEDYGGNPFVTWTMFENDTKNFLKDSINVNEITRLVMNNEIELATSVLSKLPKTKKLNRVMDRLSNFEKGDNLPSNLQAYRNIQKLVNNLRISKRIVKSKVTYRLTSNYDAPSEGTYKNFNNELRKNISMWVITNQDFWFKSIVKKAIKVIEDYVRKGK